MEIAHTVKSDALLDIIYLQPLPKTLSGKGNNSRNSRLGENLASCTTTADLALGELIRSLLRGELCV